METKSKMLSPKLDVVFHMIFGEEENERITKKLMEDVIREKYIRDRAAELDTAKEKGIKQGMEQGIKQGSIEIAKKMKLKNISIDEIAEITGLTREEIENLK